MAERARWIPLMTSATRPPTPLQSVSLHSVAPKAKKNISGQLHCNNMILSNIYKYNHVSSGPPRLPGNSLVKIAEWRGNTNNQWSTAEASERCLYLVFLGISALFHLFIFLFFGNLTYHLRPCTVQDDCFFFPGYMCLTKKHLLH